MPKRYNGFAANDSVQYQLGKVVKVLCAAMTTFSKTVFT